MNFDDILENILRTLAIALRGIVGDEFLVSFDDEGSVHLVVGEDDTHQEPGSDVEDEVNDAVEEIVEASGRLGHATPQSIKLSSRGVLGYSVTYAGEIQSPVTLP